MKNNTIEGIKEYAEISKTIQEPSEQNYAEGVKVGWTLPAKWWNWLMNAFTKRFRETKATVDSMYEELSNLMWPFVPGENETNDQCSRRIFSSMSELSEQINTNTENISANATAINTEKQARESAIEQEQTARTSQDNVLDSKITSLSNTVSANTSAISANTEAISNETAAREAADTALDGKITNLRIAVSANEENISANATAIRIEKQARQTADTALDGKITDLSNTVSANTSAIEENAKDIATNATNIEHNTTAIRTEKQERKAAIGQEQTARTQQDGVLDSKITDLSNTVNANTSAIEENTTAISDKLNKTYFLDNIKDNGTYTFNSITLIDVNTLIDIHSPSGVTTFHIHLYGALKYLAIKFIDSISIFDVLTLTSPGELVEFDMKESASSPYICRYLLLIPFYD